MDWQYLLAKVLYITQAGDAHDSVHTRATTGWVLRGHVPPMSRPTRNPLQAFFSILAEMQTTPEALLTLGPDAAPFLLYHVLPAALNSTDIPEGATSVPTLIP